MIWWFFGGENEWLKSDQGHSKFFAFNPLKKEFFYRKCIFESLCFILIQNGYITEVLMDLEDESEDE